MPSALGTVSYIFNAICYACTYARLCSNDQRCSHTLPFQLAETTHGASTPYEMKPVQSTKSHPSIHSFIHSPSSFASFADEFPRCISSSLKLSSLKLGSTKLSSTKLSSTQLVSSLSSKPLTCQRHDIMNQFLVPVTVRSGSGSGLGAVSFVFTCVTLVRFTLGFFLPARSAFLLFSLHYIISHNLFSSLHRST